MPRRSPDLATLLDSPVHRRLVAAGGAARHRHLVRVPTDQAALRGLVRTGLVVRRGPATYAVVGASDDAVLAARFDALLDCVSVARAAGLQVLDEPRETHLVVPSSRSNARRPAELRAAVRLHRGDVVEGTDPGRQELGRALARMAACQRRETAVAAIDNALYRGLVTLDDVTRHLRGRALAVASLGHAGSQSVLESLARLALTDAGLQWRTQVRFAGVGDVDLVVEGVVVIECDGYTYHQGREEFRNDRRRDRILHSLGYVVLRFAGEDILRDPEIVPRAVRAVLARRARGGSPV